MKARSGLPLFTGITTYQDPQGRFKFRHPSDWIRSDLEEDREGVHVRPEEDDLETHFAVWISSHDVHVVADDLPEVKRGFDDGMASLPDLNVEFANEDTVNNIVRVERVVTFTGGGETRRRKVWALYVDTFQLLVVYQGSTIGEYDYWLPMGNYCFQTFELPNELWFATDPELQSRDWSKY